MTSSEWHVEIDKPCYSCGKYYLTYRIVEDDEGHEDVEYRCHGCNKNWWVEGSDA